MTKDNIVEKVARKLSDQLNYSFSESEKTAEFEKHKPYYIDATKAVIEAYESESGVVAEQWQTVFDKSYDTQIAKGANVYEAALLAHEDAKCIRKGTPLERLGAYLAAKLDEDDWNHIVPYLEAANEANNEMPLPAPPTSNNSNDGGV